ncbi:hypothetical protein [Janthinobacterium lividum]|uniref:hypothetical protein n=1 Tax=Janthinobacterium lividum TaxID=29581 RepID=UPI000FE186DC|nr:hypothetical protein [Janthinobacterium lividum]
MTENKGLNNALGGIMVTCPACKATEVLLMAEFESCQEEEQSVNDPLAFFAVPGVIQAREEFEEEAARAIAMKFPTHHGIKKKVTEIFNYLERDYSEPIDVLLMVEFYERIVK